MLSLVEGWRNNTIELFMAFLFLFQFSIFYTTKWQAEKIPRFTCLKCLRDLHFGPGDSFNFASSHGKLRPSSLSDWCRCDIEPPPSAPSQQLISSSCSIGNREWHKNRNSDDQMFSSQLSVQGKFHRNLFTRGVVISHTPYIECNVHMMLFPN